MKKNKKIGLLMGSFNPIHIGHMGIANYMLEFTDLDEIQFIVSPQNPFKVNQNLLDENIRLEMVNIGIGVSDKMSASNIEFKMKKPSYTIDTIKKLKEDNKDIDYVLIIGSDNLIAFKDWKDYEYILDNVEVYVYKRIGYTTQNIKNIDFIARYNINVLENCPSIELSSTFIRESISDGKNMKYFLPPGVHHYIKTNTLYTKD